MNRVSIIIISLFFLISCNSVNKELYGNWAVFEVYYKDSDISGIDFSKKVYSANPMTIDPSQNLITLPVSQEKKAHGKFEYFSKNGKDYLEIYQASDSRFNGIYTVKIDMKKSYNNGKNKEFEVVLQSDDMYIFGTKSTVKLL